MGQIKGCGCLIGAAVRDLEVLRRKTRIRLEQINKNLKAIKDAKKIDKLKAEKKDLMKTLKETVSHKKNVKKRFDEHIKKSGYVPPKFKNHSL